MEVTATTKISRATVAILTREAPNGLFVKEGLPQIVN